KGSEEKPTIETQRHRENPEEKTRLEDFFFVVFSVPLCLCGWFLFAYTCHAPPVTVFSFRRSGTATLSTRLPFSASGSARPGRRRRRSRAARSLRGCPGKYR